MKLIGIDPSANIVFTVNKQDWYILPDKSRSYSIDIPADKCPSLKEINIEADADNLTIKDKINVDKKMCEG